MGGITRFSGGARMMLTYRRLSARFHDEQQRKRYVT